MHDVCTGGDDNNKLQKIKIYNKERRKKNNNNNNMKNDRMKIMRINK